jgi:hypothetical protein
MSWDQSNVAETGVKIGDRVWWASSAGVIHGEVVSMRLALSGAGTLIPWITIAYTRSGRNISVELCGTEDYLKMMKFSVLTRTKECA